jgi:hypothetical protein
VACVQSLFHSPARLKAAILFIIAIRLDKLHTRSVLSVKPHLKFKALFSLLGFSDAKYLCSFGFMITYKT